MIRNFLKISIRLLGRFRFYSFINVAGLALGLACSLFIFLYLRSELSFDKFFPGAEYIYRVSLERIYPDKAVKFSLTPLPLASVLPQEYPEIEAATRFHLIQEDMSISNGANSWLERNIFCADSSFFRIFDLPFLAGNAREVLKKKDSVILSARTAQRFFGEEVATGKNLRLGQLGDFEVAGVLEDLPYNSHFHPEILIPLAALDQFMSVYGNYWLVNSAYTYIQLAPGTDVSGLEKKISGIVDRYHGGQLEQYAQMTLEEFRKRGHDYHYFLQPLTSLHLYSNLFREIEINGDIRYIYIFSAVAVLILLIASINFVNLITARSLVRLKEIGMRKILGGQRKQLIMQFLVEAALNCLLALLVTFCLIEVTLPLFNRLVGVPLSLKIFTITQIVTYFLGSWLLITLLTGLYPALYLSSLNPSRGLRLRRSAISRNRLRNGLVIFQFCISMVLIFATEVVSRQTRFMLDKDLGFDKEMVIQLHGSEALKERRSIFKEELLKHGRISNATYASAIPGRAGSEITLFPLGESSTYGVLTMIVTADHDYLETLGIEIIHGRDFAEVLVSDTAAVILNEAAVRKYGWQDHLGRQLAIGPNPGDPSYELIGVVRDFNMKSLHEPVEPLAYFLGGDGNLLCLKIDSNDISSTISFIEAKWQEFLPQVAFSCTFMEEDLVKLYRSEEITARAIGIFSLLAVIIASLGLLGLAAYLVERRLKEIGIRKVLGARTGSIIELMLREYLNLILIAGLLSWSIGYWLLQRWLLKFAYHIDIGWQPFLISALIAVLTVVITVSSQTIRAALTNPADVLKYE